MVQVGQDDAAEEVNGPAEAWRRQTPRRRPIHGAAGDGAVGGHSLGRVRVRVRGRGHRPPPGAARLGKTRLNPDSGLCEIRFLWDDDSAVLLRIFP